MKITKYFTLFLLIVFLIGFNSCGNKDESSASSAIGGSGVNLNKIFSYLPESSTGLIIFDFNKAFKIKFVNDIIDKELLKKKDSVNSFFMKMDLKNSLRMVAVSLLNKENSENFFACISVKYNKKDLLELIKNEKAYQNVVNYEGKNIYFNNEDKEAFSFVEDDIIIISNKSDNIKLMIDTANNKLKSIQANNKIMSYIDEVKGKGLVYLSFIIPESERKPVNAGMMNIDLSKAEAFVGYLNYNDSIFSGEFKLISNDETANSQIATSLNGLKGFGAMLGPEVSELLNKINISSTPNFVKFSFEISEELINKVENKMKAKFAPKTESNTANNEEQVDPFKK